jgi:hypothetical protein
MRLIKRHSTPFLTVQEAEVLDVAAASEVRDGRMALK